jgi:hypothetical protein
MDVYGDTVKEVQRLMILGKIPALRKPIRCRHNGDYFCQNCEARTLVDALVALGWMAPAPNWRETLSSNEALRQEIIEQHLRCGIPSNRPAGPKA